MFNLSTGLRKTLASITIASLLSSFLVVMPAFAEVADWAQPAADFLGAETEGVDGAQAATRYQAVQLIDQVVTLAECADDVELPFTDVPADHEAREAVERAFCNNVVFGQEGSKDSPSETFAGDSTLNRAEVVTMLDRAFNWSEAADMPELTMSEAQLEEIAGEWFEAATQHAFQFGIIRGFGGEGNILGMGRNVAHNDLFVMSCRADGGAEGEDAACPLPSDDEDTPAEEGKAGTLTVSLNNDTPASVNIPGKVENALVAKFDFAANGSDMHLDMVSIKRAGLNDDGSVVRIALFDENGTRVSKSKTFTTDTDTADVNLLNGGLDITAGTTATLSVYAEIGSATAVTNYSGQTFNMEVVAAESVLSSAATVDGDFPVKANTMGIANVDAAALEVEADGTPADVKVGEQDVKVLKFKLKNGDADTDIAFSGITFKEMGTISEDTDLGSFKLFVDGDEVATTEASNGKYISFLLAEELTVQSSKTLKAYVTANILAGAGKTMQFDIDSDLDVMARDLDYGLGAQVTDSLGTTAVVNVEAGELSVVAIDAETTDIRPDKDDVVLGTLRVTANAGQDLELQKMNVNITVAGGGDVSDYFENIEFYDGRSVYSLPQFVGPAATEQFEDNDLTISLTQGETKDFEIRADMINVPADLDGGAACVPGAAIVGGAGTVDTDGDVVCDALGESFNGKTFTVKVTNIGGALPASTFYVVETDDDTAVTDVTPSSVTFKTLDGTTAAATVSKVVQSTNKSAVIGSNNIEGSVFEIKAADASDLTLDEVKITAIATDFLAPPAAPGAGAVVDLDNTRVAQLRLYKGSISEENLLDTVSGSQIAANVATFEFADVDIAAKETVRFYTTMDIVNDETMAADTVRLSVTSLSLEDDDSDDVTATVLPVLSDRTVTIQGVGTLTATADNTDTAADQTKYVLGGAESDFVASYEFVALNEAVLIEDLQIEGAAGFANHVSEIAIYASDKTTKLASKSVTGNVTIFDDVNITIAEGSENLYVKVIASKMGKDQPGTQSTDLTLKLNVIKATGVESDKAIADNAAGAIGATAGVPDYTAVSNAFATVPVYASNFEFVDSYNGVERASTLVAGENVLAIVAITAAANTNTDSVNGSSLELVMSQLDLDISRPNATVLSGFSLERIGGSNGVQTLAGITYTGNAVPVLSILNLNFDTIYGVDGGTLDGIIQNEEVGADAKIAPGTTAYYAIKASSANGGAGDHDDYARLSFNAFDTATPNQEVVYRSDDSSFADTDGDNTAANADNAADIDELRLDFSSLSGTQITE